MQTVGGAANFTSIQITRSALVNNVTTGALSDGSAGQASAIFSNTLISGNGTGVSSVGGGLLFSYKNNSLNQNDIADGAFTGTIAPE